MWISHSPCLYGYAPFFTLPLQFSLFPWLLLISKHLTNQSVFLSFWSHAPKPITPFLLFQSGETRWKHGLKRHLLEIVIIIILIAQEYPTVESKHRWWWWWKSGEQQLKMWMDVTWSGISDELTGTAGSDQNWHEMTADSSRTGSRAKLKCNSIKTWHD